MKVIITPDSVTLTNYNSSKETNNVPKLNPRPIYQQQANPNATNSELDAKIVIKQGDKLPQLTNNEWDAILSLVDDRLERQYNLQFATIREKLEAYRKEEEEINRFNFDGFIRNNYQQIVLNEEKKINTWAIFWYQTIFLNSGLCLMPNKSLVYNAGFDGTGINTSEQKYKLQKLSDTEIAEYPPKIKENSFNKFALKYYFFKLIVDDFISYHSKKITN